MKIVKPLTTKTKEKIRNLYNQGETVTSITKQCRIPRYRVEKALKELGVEPRGLSKIEQTERNMEIKKLFLEGESLAKLSAKYSLSHQRISQILYSMGIQVRIEKDKTTRQQVLEQYAQERAKLHKRYREKEGNNRKLHNDLTNARTIISNNMRAIEKLKEENEKLKDESYFHEEIAELKHTIRKLRLQVQYYKNKFSLTQDK